MRTSLSYAYSATASWALNIKPSLNAQLIILSKLLSEQNPIMPPPQSENDNQNQNRTPSGTPDHEDPDHGHDHSAPTRNEAPATQVRQLQLQNPRRCHLRPAIYFSHPPREYCDIWVMFDACGS